jgi:hypothetical protein
VGSAVRGQVMTRGPIKEGIVKGEAVGGGRSRRRDEGAQSWRRQWLRRQVVTSRQQSLITSCAGRGGPIGFDGTGA